MSVSSVCSDDDAAEGLLTSSQANIQNQVILNDCKSDKYDSCDESFSSIFQNIQSINQFSGPAYPWGVAGAAAQVGASKHLDPLQQRIDALLGCQGETN